MNKFITVSCKVSVIKDRNFFGTPTKVEEVDRNFGFNVDRILAIKEIPDNESVGAVIVLTDGTAFDTSEKFQSLVARLNDLQK